MNDDKLRKLLFAAGEMLEDEIADMVKAFPNVEGARVLREIDALKKGPLVMLDCRTCRKACDHGHTCMSTAQCVNGDQYVSVQPIQLWEKR